MTHKEIASIMRNRNSRTKMGVRYIKDGSEYKYVYKYLIGDTPIFKGCLPGWTKYYDNERAAAKGVDFKLIKSGLKPVNVLKRK